jgi:cytosine/adenosine deaminase-related metal-dependent hydrolase
MFNRSVITFTHARLLDSPFTTLRVSGHRIASLGEPPHAGDRIIDCAGGWLLPGLINAHDHLELDNFPRLKWRDAYANARDWIADFQPRFKTDPALIAPMSVPLNDRLFIGALKNLLSGVTTVAHHNSLHRGLRRRDYPVRVVQRYGWAHSLLIVGDAKVAASFRRTPANQPWIIHLAEGTDDEAAQELSRLAALGCLQPNTLIVHGVGLGDDDIRQLLDSGAGLIWCPSSNLFMLGRTIDVRALVSAGRVALGSDSRLSGERDLLDELRVAHETSGLDACVLLRLVTTTAARLLRLRDSGCLRSGAPADLVLLPAGDTPPLVSRADLGFVMLGGRALCAAPQFAAVFAATGVQVQPIRLDKREMLLASALARRLRTNTIQEAGLEIGR